jgi:predicted TIM-barrel fold metal-dependent hydrolase
VTVVTDAQVHLWLPESVGRPWPVGRQADAPYQSFLVEDLLEQMINANVARAILVPPSFEGDRNDYCLEASRKYLERFKVMGRIDLRDQDPGQKLGQWLETPGMVGVRLMAIGRTEALRLLAPENRWFWETCEKQQIPVSLFAPGHLDVIGQLATRYPDSRLAIDHLALPTAALDGDIDLYITQVCRLADFENLVVKASCLPNHVSDPFPFASLERRIAQIIHAFGVTRVFWGSDLTRARCSYKQMVRYLDHFESLSQSDRNWLLGRSCSSWLGWAEAGDL